MSHDLRPPRGLSIRIPAKYREGGEILETVLRAVSGEKAQACHARVYRDHESLPPGILDPHESRIKRDATPWARNRFPYGSIKIKAVFSSYSEPWVYCASHLSSYHTSRNLKAKFSDEYDYDAATEIQDVDAFAMWLGIDFALRIAKDEHLKLGILDTLAYWKSSYSTNLGQKEGMQNIDTVVMSITALFTTRMNRAL